MDDQIPPSETEVEALGAATSSSSDTVSVSPMASAMMAFGDVLFEAQDDLKEGLYKRLQDAARVLYEAKQHAPPSPPERGAFARFYAARQDTVRMLDEMQRECKEYQEQLTAATITIDRLNERQCFKSLVVRALESVCEAANIPDSTVMREYAALGIEEQVLEERERKRKRKRLQAAAIAGVVHLSEEEASFDEEAV